MNFINTSAMAVYWLLLTFNIRLMLLLYIVAGSFLVGLGVLMIAPFMISRGGRRLLF